MAVQLIRELCADGEGVIMIPEGERFSQLVQYWTDTLGIRHALVLLEAGI